MWFENFVSKIKYGVPKVQHEILKNEALSPAEPVSTEANVHHTTRSVIEKWKRDGIPEDVIMERLNGTVGPDGERISVIDDTLILPKDRS